MQERFETFTVLINRISRIEKNESKTNQIRIVTAIGVPTALVGLPMAVFCCIDQ